MMAPMIDWDKEPVPNLSQYDTYEKAREEFEWRIPDTYNIGGDIITRHAENPDRGNEVALYCETERGETSQYTFKELEQRSNEVATALKNRGIEQGDRVAVIASQRVETALVHVAAYKLGAIVVPLSVLYGPDALEFRISDSQAKVVFADPDVLDATKQAVETVDSVNSLVGLDELPETPDEVEAAHFDEFQGASSFEPIKTDPSDPALLAYTSGTTGRPKGILHSHQYLIGHLPCVQMAHEFPWHDADPVYYTPADWAWVGGLYISLLPAWHYGFPAVGYLSSGYEPEKTFELFERYEISYAHITPTMLKMMTQVNTDPYDLDTLVTLGIGGEPVPSELHKWVCEMLDVPLNEVYGQTEANLIISNCSQWFEPEPGSMGRPVPGHTVDIVDEDGSRLPAGEEGIIALQVPDPVAFLEHWNELDSTDESFFGENAEWMDTDDVGYRDDDSRLWFVARDDDVIITSGYRVSPTEVEDALIAHEAVANAAVIGVDHEIRGQVVKGFVVLTDEYEPSNELSSTIQNYIRENLAKYQYPKELEVTDELPKTTTGKIQRHKLE